MVAPLSRRESELGATLRRDPCEVVGRRYRMSLDEERRPCSGFCVHRSPVLSPSEASSLDRGGQTTTFVPVIRAVVRSRLTGYSPVPAPTARRNSWRCALPVRRGGRRRRRSRWCPSSPRRSGRRGTRAHAGVPIVVGESHHPAVAWGSRRVRCGATTLRQRYTTCLLPWDLLPDAIRLSTFGESSVEQLKGLVSESPTLRTSSSIGPSFERLVLSCLSASRVDKE